MFVLDTNIVSESRKLGTARVDPVAAAWFDRIDVADTFLSAMTVFELERGVRQMEHRDTAQGLLLRRWFEHQVMTTYEGRILPLTGAVSIACAALHSPDPKAERDAWIAATAMNAKLTLATRNVGDFARMGVPLINPFEREVGP